MRDYTSAVGRQRINALRGTGHKRVSENFFIISLFGNLIKHISFSPDRF